MTEITMEKVNTLGEVLDLFGQCSEVIIEHRTEIFQKYLIDEIFEEKELQNGRYYIQNYISNSISQAKLSIERLEDRKELAIRGLADNILRFKLVGINDALQKYRSSKKWSKLRLMRILRSIRTILDSLSSIFPVVEALLEIADTLYNWMLDRQRSLS